jgi:cyanate lyase
MTGNDLEKIIESNSRKETVSTEIGIKAGLTLAELAEKAKIDWAFAGGIAMHIYGFDRATSDVDVIADKILDLESEKQLSFGGESYQVAVGERQITVDWIVRNDEFAKFYAPALAEAIKIGNGVRIIAPDWLVILKHLAGRPKDQLDLIWLLQETGLVNREKVIENIKSVLGEFAIYLISNLQSEFDYADVIKMRGERSKYE